MYQIGTSSSLKARIISVFLSLLCFFLSFCLIVKVKVQTQATSAAAISFLIGGYLILIIGTCKENLDKIFFALKKLKEETVKFVIEITN